MKTTRMKTRTIKAAIAIAKKRKIWMNKSTKGLRSTMILVIDGRKNNSQKTKKMKKVRTNRKNKLHEEDDHDHAQAHGGDQRGLFCHLVHLQQCIMHNVEHRRDIMASHSFTLINPEPRNQLEDYEREMA